MTEAPPERNADQTPPAKKATSRRPAKKAAASTRQVRAKQVAVRMIRKSRGVPIGAQVDVDAERAAELVASGLASYVE